MRAALNRIASPEKADGCALEVSQSPNSAAVSALPTSIGVIIPTYNRASMLRECIDSILAQTRPVQQIIVVNDGSTDETESLIASYGERVTLLTKENGGKASALNLALPHCKMDYVWICDDDDIAERDGAEHLAAALDANASVDFAYSTFRHFH